MTTHLLGILITAFLQMYMAGTSIFGDYEYYDYENHDYWWTDDTSVEPLEGDTDRNGQTEVSANPQSLASDNSKASPKLSQQL